MSLNYSAPTLETLRDIFASYQVGEAELDEVLEEIQAVAEHVSDYLDQLDEQADSGLVDIHQEGYQMIREGFEEHLTGLELLEENPDSPKEGLDKIQSAVNLMVQGRRSLAASHEKSDFLTCVFCGQQNSVLESRCGKCSRQLPVTGATDSDGCSISVKEGSSSDSEMMTQEFVSLNKAVEKWRAGEISDYELLDDMDRLNDALAEQHEANAGIPKQLARLGAGAQAEGLLVSQRSAEALEKSAGALVTMRRAFETGDGSYLENGLHAFYLQAKVLVECHAQLCRLEGAFS